VLRNAEQGSGPFRFQRWSVGKEAAAVNYDKELRIIILARILCGVGSFDSWLATVYKSHSGRNVLRLTELCVKCFATEKF
jgi:hypothetical protein